MNVMPKGQSLRAVLIDLDDTLFPHEQFARSAIKAAAREFRRRTGLASALLFDEAWRRYLLHGSRDNRAFTDIMLAHGCYSPELEAQILAAYRRCRPVLKPFKNVAVGLERLRDAGLMLGLLTDGRSMTQRMKLKALGLAPFFDEIVITGDYGPAWSKPAPHGFELLLNRFGCTPDQALMLGDDPLADSPGAHALGLAMVRVRQGRYRKDDDPLASAEFSEVNLALAWILHNKQAPS